MEWNGTDVEGALVCDGSLRAVRRVRAERIGRVGRHMDVRPKEADLASRHEVKALAILGETVRGQKAPC